MVDLAEIQAAYYMVAATGVLVAAAYYVMNINNLQKSQKITLETRYAQVFNMIFSPAISKEGLKHVYTIQRNLFTSVEEYNELIKNKEFAEADLFWRQIYESGGAYVREGAIPIRYFAEMNAWFHLWMWEHYKEVIYEQRKIRQINNFYYQWEYLYNTLKEYLAEHPELAPSRDAQLYHEF